MWIGTEVTVKEDVGIGLYCGYGVCGDRESRTLYPLSERNSARSIRLVIRALVESFGFLDPNSR